MSTNEIVHQERGVELVFDLFDCKYRSGERLYMENGEVWFHPHSGGPPRFLRHHFLNEKGEPINAF